MSSIYIEDLLPDLATHLPISFADIIRAIGIVPVVKCLDIRIRHERPDPFGPVAIGDAIKLAAMRKESQIEIEIHLRVPMTAFPDL